MSEDTATSSSSSSTVSSGEINDADGSQQQASILPEETTTTRTSRKKTNRRSRQAPYPNSILDRRALEQALEDANIVVKNKQRLLTAFYAQLHRQHYPSSLKEFVSNYHRMQRGEVHVLQQLQQKANDGGSADADDDSKNGSTPRRGAPLRNAISTNPKRNQNKVQLPKAFLEFLETTKDFVTMTSNVDQVQWSADGTTTKLAVRLADDYLVESVIMRYANEHYQVGRASLCVSSQVGCAMGCTFCATGTMGIRGNLTSAEIMEQMIHANRILAQGGRQRQRQRGPPPPQQQQHQPSQGDSTSGIAKKLELIRNVVFMGMGEPLNNYDNVVEACRAFVHPQRWNLAYHKITVSTVGVTPRIKQLTHDLPEISLALSLHAPNQAMRSAIVPTATAYPIERLMDAVDAHISNDTHLANNRNRKHKPRQQQQKENEEPVVEESPATTTQKNKNKKKHRRRAMIEYVMLEGDTSSFQCAHELGALCASRHNLMVNLIPYNATDTQDPHACPPEDHLLAFRNIVASYGVMVTIRRTMGADIDSACGQLVKDVGSTTKRAATDGNKKKSSGNHHDAVTDIEDAAKALLQGRTTTGARTTLRSTNNNTARNNIRRRRSRVVAVSSDGKTSNEVANNSKKPLEDDNKQELQDITTASFWGWTSSLFVSSNNETTRNKDNNDRQLSSSSSVDHGRMIKTLAVATTISGTAFVISSLMYVFLHQRQQQQQRLSGSGSFRTSIR